MAIASRSFPAPDRVPVRRALLSVFDKTGLIDLAKALASHGVELLSTGGSAKALKDAGLAVKDVSDVTGFPEIMDGRVKTLHPAVHGGLLAIRDADDHVASMEEHGIGAIDLLVVNLYPFAEVMKSGADAATIIENIDIGGPAMLRAAAKNHAYVSVLTSPDDYAGFIAELADNDGASRLATRQKLAQATYARTAVYDAGISNWMAEQFDVAEPANRAFGGPLLATMRYGENPHQQAALYGGGVARPGVTTARQLQGKQLSYNNINDTDAAFELASEFDADQAAVAIIKHANPCGVATGETLEDAYQRAFDCDPVSAFGGIIAMNRPLTGAAAEKMVEIFTEVIIAPDADDAAREVLAAKKNLRLLVTGAMADPAEAGLTVRNVAGGYLVQGRDAGRVTADDLKVVTKRQPNAQEMADMLFAFRVAKHVKSNAIIYAKDGATVGIGAGQMSRVDSSRIAARKAVDAAEAAGWDGPKTVGSVVASDAFFPFADGLLSAAEAGATAVIQPGGSMRDDDVIAAADEAGLAMVFTGMRHFRH
ncbi:bifunctional phosphoribosylaminoimidazolecarboxamide formyltransferase/IMP cyclohydrolase [Pseudahrensia aquimaris]|uniref:Bifunctional purine biosynthesis protein PurH n=1 Tax=Pseudahrensia aquimaris TaxID=744461 RepID=A0ABW3FDL6_9HYPH